MIQRDLGSQLNALYRQYPVVTVTGPRQSGKTVSDDFFKGLRYWSRISGADAGDMLLVYAGLMDQTRKDGRVLSWRSFGKKLPIEL